jgi:hypothetical protein
MRATSEMGLAWDRGRVAPAGGLGALGHCDTSGCGPSLPGARRQSLELGRAAAAGQLLLQPGGRWAARVCAFCRHGGPGAPRPGNQRHPHRAHPRFGGRKEKKKKEEKKTKQGGNGNPIWGVGFHFFFVETGGGNRPNFSPRFFFFFFGPGRSVLLGPHRVVEWLDDMVQRLVRAETRVFGPGGKKSGEETKKKQKE